MKKSLFILMAIVAFTVVSCSKDAKINRRIDGEWKVITYDGETVPADESMIFSFSKDEKKTGTGTYTETYDGEGESMPFTYTVANEKITIVVDGFAEIFTVDTYEKKKMEFTDSWGDKWVLEPK